MAKIVLKTEGLTKHYGGIHALQDADFELKEGEHVAIVGDNGAGKSTFVRQITGRGAAHRRPDLVRRQGGLLQRPLDAREAGMECVFQNLALCDDLDVPSNLFLGREKILVNLGPFSILDKRGMRKATEDGLKRTGVRIPRMDYSIRRMSGGQRQGVAIARTATFASKMIIMDEPTAALGVQETAQVENIIRTLKAQGTPLILISHNLRQVFDLADRIVVFRRGPHRRQPPQGGNRRQRHRGLHHRA
jgi:fructose transport system ATP-binding protein